MSLVYVHVSEKELILLWKCSMRKASCVLVSLAPTKKKNSLDEFFIGYGYEILCSNMADHFLSLEKTIDGEWHRAWQEGP